MAAQPSSKLTQPGATKRIDVTAKRRDGKAPTNAEPPHPDATITKRNYSGGPVVTAPNTLSANAIPELRRCEWLASDQIAALTVTPDLHDLEMAEMEGAGKARLAATD